jgi:hypothetical protein
MVRDNPDLNKRVADMTALGRAGLPDDIGPMIASLPSEDIVGSMPSALRFLVVCRSDRKERVTGDSALLVPA